MTRVALCQADDLQRLEDVVNGRIEMIEADGYGITDILNVSYARSGPAVLLVYGQGHTTIRRWGGLHG